MKKTLKTIVSLLIVTVIFASMLTLNVSAANVTVSGGQYNVGQKVNISVKFTADATLYAVEVDASYNSSVLRLDSVSGADFTVNNDVIKIVDDNFSATKPSNTASYTLSFTAIAAGNSNISVNVLGGGEATSKASASAAVAVVTPKPSSNANLSSLNISGVALSPAFNANTTSYNATVKYTVSNVTVSAAVADSGATYGGGGSWDLKVGDNSRTLTVTAADGTKKSYTVNIKRMTEEETAKAEQDARDANPTLVIIDGIDYTIVNNFEGLSMPAGFAQATATRKDAEVAVINDEHGEYQLYYLTDANGENGAFYTRDENDVFTRVNYINANGKMYIVEDPTIDGNMPEGYVSAKRKIDESDVSVYNFVDEGLKDFYIVKCYVDGQRAYYCFDSVEGTLQRAVAFDLAVKKANTEPDPAKTGKMAWFTNMDTNGKIVFLIIIFAALALIAVAVILIVKIATANREDEYVVDCGGLQPDAFILDDTDEEILENTEIETEE